MIRGDYGSLASHNLDEKAEQKKAEDPQNIVFHFTDKVMYPAKFKTMLANALTHRMDLVLAGERNAKAELDALDQLALFHLNIYFLTYSKKIEIENPPQAQFLHGLAEQ